MVTAWQQDRRRKQAGQLKSESVAGLEALLGGLSDIERQRIAEEERKRKAEAAAAEKARDEAEESRKSTESTARIEREKERTGILRQRAEAEGSASAARADVLRKKAEADDAERARAEADRKRADTITSMSRRMDALTSRADVEKAAAEAGMAPDEFLAAVGEQQEKALGEQAKAESRLDLEDARAEQARASAEKAKRPPVIKPKKAPDPGKQTKDAMGLRKEFTARPEVKLAVDSGAALRKMEAAAGGGAAGDLALIFAFMKVMDPTSTVRESEFANAENAKGVDEWLRSKWNKAKSGERLTTEQRADFVRQAKIIADAYKSDADKVRAQYRGIAERSGLNPIDVVGEDEPTAAPAPAQAAPAAPAPAKPAGRRFKVTNGAETFDVDEADLPEALAEGFKVVKRG